MPRRVVVVAGSVVVAVAVVTAGAWLAVRDDHQRSVEETVADFFEARRDGDCARLFRLVSRADATRDGQWDRHDFVDACTHVVDQFQPKLDEVEVLTTGDDRSLVSLSVVRDDSPTLVPDPDGGGIVVTGPDDAGQPVARLYQEGLLVREAGEWRVESDLGLLRIGRSVEDTVRSYIAAYNDGDCERQVDLLSEAVWSNDGLLSRERYLDQCAQAVTDRAELPVPDAAASDHTWVADPQSIEVSLGRERRDVATARLAPSPGDPNPSSTASFIRDGLQWRLDGRLQAVAYLELAMVLAPEPLPGVPLESVTDVRPSAAPSLDNRFEGSDAAERRREAGFRRGVSGQFQQDAEGVYTSGYLSVYQFDSNRAAAAYATHLAARIVARSGYTAVDPLPSGAVGGAIRTYCVDDSCGHSNEATLVAVHDDEVVMVNVHYSRDNEEQTPAEVSAKAAQVLQAQLARL